MAKFHRIGFFACLALIAAILNSLVPPSAEAAYSAFRCELRNAYGFLEDLQTFSGIKWIECIVGEDNLQIDRITINHGNCEAFDYWLIDRIYSKGETLNIRHSCLSPVTLEITANGRTFGIPLK